MQNFKLKRIASVCKVNSVSFIPNDLQKKFKIQKNKFLENFSKIFLQIFWKKLFFIFFGEPPPGPPPRGDWEEAEGSGRKRKEAGGSGRKREEAGGSGRKWEEERELKTDPPFYTDPSKNARPNFLLLSLHFRIN